MNLLSALTLNSRDGGGEHNLRLHLTCLLNNEVLLPIARYRCKNSLLSR